MIELPEIHTISGQINDTVVGKTILKVTADANPHTFAWYTGDPLMYHDRLSGKTVTASYPGTNYTNAAYTEIVCENVLLAISTSMRFHDTGSELPSKHHLLIDFTDGSHLSCTVHMWGAMYCYDTNNVTGYDKTPSPLEPEFDMNYFMELLNGVKPITTVKGLLTTDQRIPGLGNGVLHDILFNAKIHPKLKISQLTSNETESLFDSIKTTLYTMTAQGGRNTEKDLYGNYGGYRTILSSKTKRKPCTVCGNNIERETFLGGNIYYCPTCQIYR